MRNELAQKYNYGELFVDLHCRVTQMWSLRDYLHKGLSPQGIKLFSCYALLVTHYCTQNIDISKRKSYLKKQMSRVIIKNNSNNIDKPKSYS